jgi:hypothetical protein
LEQRLNLYALAASAAGVGMLVLAQPAQAKIVYTPTHRVIGKDGHFNLDVNRDGITDFTLVNSYRSGTCCSLSDVLKVNPVVGNGVEGKPGGGSFAYALNRGAQIGPTRPFAGKLMAARACDKTSCSMFYGSSGSWINATNKYLGLKFQIHGKTHYGWARLSTQNAENEEVVIATLTGYAYETVPDKPIVAGKTSGPDEESSSGPADPAVFNAPAPEPATLGLLAMGWPELSVWRRKESAGAAQ